MTSTGPLDESHQNVELLCFYIPTNLDLLEDRISAIIASANALLSALGTTLAGVSSKTSRMPIQSVPITGIPATSTSIGKRGQASHKDGITDYI